MRYPKGHKEETRQRVLRSAGQRFRREGIGQVGVAALMHDAGLTHGGFYSHFPSKEALVAASLESGMDDSFERIQVAARRAGIRGLIEAYLSVEHLEKSETGCPAAALAPEIGRLSEATRAAFSRRVAGMTALIAEHLSPPDAVDRAQALFAMLVGTMQLARAVDNTTSARQLLDAGRVNALRLAGVE